MEHGADLPINPGIELLVGGLTSAGRELHGTEFLDGRGGERAAGPANTVGHDGVVDGVGVIAGINRWVLESVCGGNLDGSAREGMLRGDHNGASSKDELGTCHVLRCETFGEDFLLLRKAGGNVGMSAGLEVLGGGLRVDGVDDGGGAVRELAERQEDEGVGARGGPWAGLAAVVLLAGLGVIGLSGGVLH